MNLPYDEVLVIFIQWVLEHVMSRNPKVFFSLSTLAPAYIMHQQNGTQKENSTAWIKMQVEDWLRKLQ